MKPNILFFLIFTFSYILGFAQTLPKEFSTQIKTIKSINHKRIPGTKLFAIIPSDFKYIKGFSRYQKNEDLYLTFVESEGASYTKSKKYYTRESIESQGGKIDIINNIYVNNFEAIYTEGPSKIEGETKIGIVFGSDSLVFIIVGVCKNDDFQGKKELQSILLSIFWDKSFQLNPLELANFDFERTITNFLFTHSGTNNFKYTENGVKDKDNSKANAMVFTSFPLMNKEFGLNFTKDLIENHIIMGDYEIENKTVKEIKINNYVAFETESKFIYKETPGIFYQIVILGPLSTISFYCTDYTPQKKYNELYKKTAKTIKFKD